MKATVDTNVCNGCGICEIICPEIFRMAGSDGKQFAVVRAETVPEQAVNFCVDARDCCKPEAILLTGLPATDSAPQHAVV